MPFVNMIGGLLYPRLGRYQAAAPVFTNIASIADNNDAAAFIFQAPKTGTIKRVQFRTGAVTTAADLKVTLQDVDLTTGKPDGVIDQFRVVTGIATDTWYTTGIISSDGTDTGTKRTVNKGDLLAVVILANVTPISLSIACVQLDATVNAFNFPYISAFTTAWGSPTGRVSCIAIQYTDDSYAEIAGDAMPANTLTIDNLTNITTPDEVGMKFKLPFGCKVDGLWYRSNGSGDHDLVLYDSNGTSVLTSLTQDKDIKVGTSLFDHARFFPAEVTLLPNTFYRLTIRPSTGTSISLGGYTVATADLLDMTEGGQNIHWTQRTDAGVWTDTTTKRAFMGLRISAINAGGGSGDVAYFG